MKNKSEFLLPLVLIFGILTWFLGFEVLYEKSLGKSVATWSYFAWNEQNDFLHGRAIPIAFIIFVVAGWRKMAEQEQKPSNWGLIAVMFGLLLYLSSYRTLQPRLALVGLPFIITGAVHFICGWKVTRLMLFPAFFWYFAIPLPGIQQATNFLQVFVTNACYTTGTFLGMDIVNTGDQIRSATQEWDVEIAPGCSGIRSLMALVMIAAIYAYYTQKSFYKKVILFSCSLPLAVLGNFFRVFTILVLSSLGQSKFAAGLYHDWAGMLIFFPVSLIGLFAIDNLVLNRKKRKKVVTKVGKQL